MSEPEDRGEAARGRRYMRPAPPGDAGGQAAQGGWPARYGPRPDFTLPPDSVSPDSVSPGSAGTLPGEELPADRPRRHSSRGEDSGWFTKVSEDPWSGADTGAYEGTRRSGHDQPAADPGYPQPGRPATPATPAADPGNRQPTRPAIAANPVGPAGPARPSFRPAPDASFSDDGYRTGPRNATPQSAAPQSAGRQPGRRRRPEPQNPPAPQPSLAPQPAAPPGRGTPSAPRAPQPTSAPQFPSAPPDREAPANRTAQPGFLPHDEDPADYGRPVGYAGRRGRNREPRDYDFTGRDSRAGRTDPSDQQDGYADRAGPSDHQDGYADRAGPSDHQDGYADRGDRYADRDGYAGRGDPYGERDGYAGRGDPFADQAGYGDYAHDDYAGPGEYTQHVAGPGRFGPRDAASAGQEPAWDDEDGYDDERFVPGLGGRDEEYDGDHDDEPGRGGRGGGRSRRRASGGGTGRRRWVIPLVVILVILLIPLGVGGFYTYRFVQGRYYPADYSTGGTGQAIVQVQSGQSATAVGQRLVTLGVVASVRAFELAAEHSTSQGTLEPGFYRLKKHMKATLAFQLLLNPSARIQDKITIPEGLRLTQIEAQLGAHSGIPLADFQQALKQPASLGLPSYADGKPEGYLFPATYEVQPNQTATDVLKTMVQRFSQEAASDNLTQAATAAHLTAGQVVTVASLIQAEGGSTSYYAQIARVIYNRLNMHMKLQLDSTVMYGLNTFGIIASNQQLQSNSPYNTYKFAGLPPGPIDSPGHAAIEAALHPASGNDLYFVTTNPKTGLTKFTSSPTQFEQFRQELEHNLGQ